MISPGCDDIPTEAERPSQFRRRRAVVTHRLVTLAGSAPVLIASNSGRELLEEAFDIGMYHQFSDRDIFVAFHDCSSFLVLAVSEHFSNDPDVTSNDATGHQLITLCRPICAEVRAQIMEPLMSSKNFRCIVHVCSFLYVHRLLDCSQD